MKNIPFYKKPHIYSLMAMSGFFYLCYLIVDKGIRIQDEQTKAKKENVIVLEYGNKIYKLDNTYIDPFGNITGRDIETNQKLTFNGYKQIHEN